MVLSVPQNFSFFLSLCYITSVTNVTVMLSNGSHLKFHLSISFLSIFVQFPHTSHFSNKSINFKFFQTRNIMTTPTKTREFRYLSPSIYIQKKIYTQKFHHTTILSQCNERNFPFMPLLCLENILTHIVMVCGSNSFGDDANHIDALVTRLIWHVIGIFY